MLEPIRAASSCLSFTPETVGDHGGNPPFPPPPPFSCRAACMEISAVLCFNRSAVPACQRQEGTEGEQQPDLRYRPEGP